MANTAVQGRIIFAESGGGISGLTVSAFDVDPLSGDDHLGKDTTKGNGDFHIKYTTDTYRTWFIDRNPDIEVRIFGEGMRLLWETPKQDNVQDDVLDVGTIRIHESNFRVPGNDDPSWLVTHTSLDPANGVPVRLTAGNQIDWLVDGAAMFPAITDDIANLDTTSIKLVNNAFAVKELVSKFEFDPATGRDHTNVLPTDAVKVHRLEKIMLKQVARDIPVQVLIWDLMDTGDLLSVLLFDRVDTADEVKKFFEGSKVQTDTLETSQLLHIKAVVVDGNTGPPSNLPTTKAYVVGSTMKQGYFSDQHHLIRDARHGARELTHDVSLKVEGPAARFVDQTFCTLWNAGPNVTQATPAPQRSPIAGGASVQVLRTLPGEMFTSTTPGPDTENLPHGETGILESYQRAIMKAEEYIYIEDQYFVCPEVFNAIKLRMAEKPDLEVILVLNVKPDIGGYQKKQMALINELRDSLGAGKDRLGIFTMWSSDANHTPFEIAHIYVHAKLAIIDDKWASVGTANLDGASMNQRQWGLILLGTLEELSPVTKVVVTLLAPVFIALLMLPYAPLVLLASAAFTVPTLMPFIVDSIKKEVARTTEHANPNRVRQPPRHPELNLVLYNDIAGQGPTNKIKELRESLWKEQLGPPIPATKPSNGWLSHWRQVASANLTNIRNATNVPPNAVATDTKILEWVAERDKKEYLRSLGVNVESPTITVRGSGERMPFQVVEAQP